MSNYEQLPPMLGEDHVSVLEAAYEADGGICLWTWGADADSHWMCRRGSIELIQQFSDCTPFSLTTEQAEQLGTALLRWAADERAQAAIMSVAKPKWQYPYPPKNNASST